MEEIMGNPANSRLEAGSQREIDRLNAKCRDYEGIREKQSQEIFNLKQALRDKNDEMGEGETKSKREIKRLEAIIVEQQKNLDELRGKICQGNGIPDHSHIYEEYCSLYSGSIRGCRNRSSCLCPTSKKIPTKSFKKNLKMSESNYSMSSQESSRNLLTETYVTSLLRMSSDRYLYTSAHISHFHLFPLLHRTDHKVSQFVEWAA
jgi:hypothetical protein